MVSPGSDGAVGQTYSEENALAQVPHSTVWEERKDYKASAKGTGNRSPVGLEILLA